jgi:sugar (pentulose or hexulose) kinase
VGKITKEFSALTGVPEGLPLVSTGSDKGCETLGLSVTTPDKASISFGTTATIQLAVKDYFEPQKFLPAYPAVISDMYNPEIEIYRGFWLLSWFVQEFGTAEAQEAERLGCAPEKILDERIKDIPAGSDGLLLQPYWTSGILKPNSMGAVVGFSDFHTRYHLYRAIIEGIDLELFMALDIMERRSGLKIRELYVSGGGARSDVVCHITADVFGLPVKRIQTHEACSIGSSMAGFVSMGVFRDYDEAAASMVHVKDTFEPDMENHRVYMEIYKKAYCKIYGKLEPIYKRLIDIYKRR